MLSGTSTELLGTMVVTLNILLYVRFADINGYSTVVAV